MEGKVLYSKREFISFRRNVEKKPKKCSYRRIFKVTCNDHFPTLYKKTIIKRI